MLKNLTKNLSTLPNSVITYIVVSTIVLFLSSFFRHILFNSNAFDLGIFDNGIYLISQFKEPYVAFRNLHILGDHGAWILYAIALFYLIYPSIYWLFIVQSLAFSLALIPIYYLSKQEKLSHQQAKTICLVYLFYPVVFNVNLFDFHPEVIAIPLIFAALLATKLNKFNWFAICIILILGCKAVLALNIIALGVWLIISQRRQKFGWFAMIAGVVWFLVATQLIIPHFSGEEAAAVGRYSFLGDSVVEIATNLIFKPQIILSYLFTLTNLEYLLLLISPVIWGLSWQSSVNLIPAIPTLFLNLLTDYQPQKDLIHQYSLPIIPFLILTVMVSLASGYSLLKSNRNIIIWSLVGFIALAKPGFFAAKYLQNLDTWKASNQALTMIDSQGSILTASQFSPHLTHRPILKLATQDLEYDDLTEFDYILLNLDNPGWNSNREVVDNLINKAQNNSHFKLVFAQNNIFLFKQIN